MREHLPTIVEYFNTILTPRLPYLGAFSDDPTNPGKVVCPFHDDVNPSLGVIPNTQIFNCFGCSAHGTVVALHILTVELLLHQTLTREEALQELYEMYEVTPKVVTPKDRVKTLISAASSPSFGSFNEFRNTLSTVRTSVDWSRALVSLLVNDSLRSEALRQESLTSALLYTTPTSSPASASTSSGEVTL